MYPVLLEIGGFRLHTYGVAVALALVVALWVAGREADRYGLGRGVIDDLTLPVMFAGFLGGRLAYVIGWEPELLWTDPLGVVAVWRGGLALHGAILGGFGAALWVCRRRRLPPWRVADAVAPALAAGQAIGRLGCFLSGDSYGRPTDVPWAVTFRHPDTLAPPGVPLHPVQLYEAALDLVLFAALLRLGRHPAPDGRRFLIYLGGYGLVRLVTEVFRGDRMELALGLSLLQVVSLGLIAAAVLGLVWSRPTAEPVRS